MSAQNEKPATCDPFLDVHSLLAHTFHYKEDAYLALKVLIARLPEAERTRFASDSLRQCMDFCASHRLLSNLAPLNYSIMGAKAKKHGFTFYGNDPMKDNFWKQQPDSYHWYYLKMLLTRLPARVRFVISTRLLMIILTQLPCNSFLAPYNPMICKLKISDETTRSSAQCVTEKSDPLADPFSSCGQFWNVVDSSNAYPLLKQLLARCTPEVRATLAIRMLKSSFNYISKKNSWDILASYDPSKANHIPPVCNQVNQVPVQTNGKTFILAQPGQMPNGSSEPEISSQRDSSLDEQIVDHLFDTTSYDQLPTTDEAYRNILWTRTPSEHYANASSLKFDDSSDFLWTRTPSEHYASANSLKFENLSDFLWTRTPSDYYVRDSPLCLGEHPDVSSNFDWTQPPSEGDGNLKEATKNVDRVNNSGCSSRESNTSERNVSLSKDWSKTPTNAGADAKRVPRRLLSELELSQPVPPTTVNEMSVNKTLPVNLSDSIYSYISWSNSTVSCSCHCEGAAPINRQLSSNDMDAPSTTPPLLHITRSDASTQTPNSHTDP